MSLQRLTSEDHETDQPNFFWLSQLGPIDLFYSFLKPNSSKSSLPTSAFTKQTQNCSRPSSSRIMSSEDETYVTSGNTSAAPTITSSDDDQATPQAKKGDNGYGQWRPGKREWAVMITFVVSNLVVALESSILVTVLPARLFFPSVCFN